MLIKAIAGIKRQPGGGGKKGGGESLVGRGRYTIDFMADAAAFDSAWEKVHWLFSDIYFFGPESVCMQGSLV